MPIILKTDNEGNVVTKPLTGWITGTLAEIAVLLAVEYLLDESGDERGQIQLALTPQQCLELAEKLTKLAQRVLDEGESSTGKSPN